MSKFKKYLSDDDNFKLIRIVCIKDYFLFNKLPIIFFKDKIYEYIYDSEKQIIYNIFNGQGEIWAFSTENFNTHFIILKKYRKEKIIKLNKI